MELKNKTVIVTGAGRGIGKAIALDCARAGGHIVVTARSAREIQAVAGQIRKAGGRALGLALDLSNPNNITSLLKETVKAFKSVDILINNAGYASWHKPFLDETAEEWDKTFGINLRSAFLLSKECFALMKKKRSGYIVNISSTVVLGPPATMTAYSASKAGLAAMSQSLHENAKQYGVRVSTVYPGITDTKMVRDLKPSTKPPVWMQPQDISDCVMFLLRTSKRMIIKDLVPWSFQHDRV